MRGVNGLLLDQGLSRHTSALLRQHGVACEHVSDALHPRAKDEEILAEALRRDWWIVTLDTDFHELLALTGADGPSVILIRIQGLSRKPLADLLMWILNDQLGHLIAGAAVTVTPRQVRSRLLPISRL